MEDVIYNAIGCQLPYGPNLFALLRTAKLVDIVSYRMLPCTISTYSPAPVINRRHGDRALPVQATSVPAADGAEEEAPRVDIPVVPANLRRQRYSSLPVGMDQAESSSSRSSDFADVDEVAGRPTPLTGATEDHPPTEKDPASTAEGDTTALAEVSASAFLDVDEAAGRPTPLTGATEDRTPTEEDPASTTEGDTTAPSEASPTAIVDSDEAAGRQMPLTSVIEDRAPTAKDTATTVEGPPTSVVVATIEGDTTATAEVSSTVVAETDDPIAAINLVASTIDDD
ncbi:hypothetical protein E2562_001169 [Oryza meyeriana var. granulata]|uniref:Uncharacterized protein n=1 Tax=Oryza meyeriana var. granulata TaxID=110450 RepID=A0A6G1DCK6_9ORYZ|nr:hypothetical protein E2562_001169 [Oryza meyeriana var. granulata]